MIKERNSAAGFKEQAPKKIFDPQDPHEKPVFDMKEKNPKKIKKTLDKS